MKRPVGLPPGPLPMAEVGAHALQRLADDCHREGEGDLTVKFVSGEMAVDDPGLGRQMRRVDGFLGHGRLVKAVEGLNEQG